MLPKKLIEFVLSWITPEMRSPSGGLSGWMAMKIMERINPPSISEGIKRQNLQPTDVFVELGAGHGYGLYEVCASHKPDEFPQRIVCVEISPEFRTKLTQVKQELQTKVDSELPIEIHGADAKDMSEFLSDESVHKIFAMNVVYFLDPLPEYLKEIHRVLAKEGKVTFGCKFPAVADNKPPFFNTKEKAIVNMMQEAGFDVTSTFVKVSGDPLSDYTELTGVKL